MKTALETPADLDYQARKKWEELITSVDPDADAELLSNYCRQYSNLLAIRREKKRQQKSGKFRTMVKGRDGTMALHPLITAENRMVASLNRMLQTLGLASREQTKGKRPLSTTPRPSWAKPGAEEPTGGWAIEAALCGYNPDGTMNETHPDHPNFSKRRLM